MDGQGPIVSSDDRARTWLTLAAGVVATAAAIFAVMVWWPSGSDDVADTPGHYDLPVGVTHIIVDRFLPFDDRVLIRVYASPTDGRSGGGYVSYDTTGTLVDTCC